jgi:hypothetical protein
MNHGAYCSCSPGFSGDPFDICYEDYDEDPYNEYLCGPYSKFINVTSVDDSYCLCLETFRGRPPNCTFIECYTDDDCYWNENCDFNECVDPCDPNPCGQFSKCRSEGHQRARCSCLDGYFPEADFGCRLEKPEDKLMPVESIQEKFKGYCGTQNCSRCKNNTDCPTNHVCISEECTENPCLPFCGYQASCEVHDGKIECYCEEINKYNPFMECPRLVDTDHICANANRPECGVSLAQIFKHYMHQELDYGDYDEKHRIGVE